MGKYNSPYYNSERYYDPTAGAALLSVIREERKRYSRRVDKVPKTIVERSVVVFADEFSEFYGRTFGLRANGKPRKFARRDKICTYLMIYQYCMEHADEAVFTIDAVVKWFHLGTDKIVRQIFTERGDINKLIISYKAWIDTGVCSWGGVTQGDCI